MTKASRKLHLWLGLLFAPTLIFFAVSGALQVFGLHEAEGGQSPPSWISKLAEVHKIQSIEERPSRSSRPSGAVPTPTERTIVAVPIGEKPQATPAREATPRASVTRTAPHRSIPLMLWFAALGVALVASTVLGIYMAFAYRRDRVTVLGLLAAGVVIPVVFAFL